MGGVDSDIGEVEVGMLQGSRLGPLLFLIYTNDLSSAVQGSTISMYGLNSKGLCLRPWKLQAVTIALIVTFSTQ